MTYDFATYSFVPSVTVAEARGLIRFALDMLAASENEHCCSICCAPCHALKSLADDGRLDEFLAGDEDAARCDWWVDGKVDREWLAHAWRPGMRCHNESEMNTETPEAS